MCKKMTEEEKFQAEWLKNNKPNSYFDTVTDKRVDKYIGTEIKYIKDNKEVKNLIIKRRSAKDEKGVITHHYFVNNDTAVFTKDEVESSLVKSIMESVKDE